MKKYIILLGVLCTVVLSGCYKEDPIHAELTKYWRDYDVNSTDPAWKLVSQYWEKFDKAWIYDPDERDYLYNFQQKNDVEITAPSGNFHQKLLLHDELFMTLYSDEGKKTIFPFSVIIADKIIDKTGWSPKEANFFGSRSFLAFKITDADLALDAAGKKTLAAAMHKSFILDFCLKRNKADLDPQFGKLSNYTDAGYVWAEKDLGIEIAYEKGFLYYQPYKHYAPPTPEKPWRHSFRSDVPGDLKDYYEKLLSLTDEELAALRAKWPLVDQKMGYLIRALESIGVDYKDLK